MMSLTAPGAQTAYSPLPRSLRDAGDHSCNSQVASHRRSDTTTARIAMSKLRGLCAGMLAGGAMIVTAACNESRDTGAVTSKTDAGTSSAPRAEAVEERDMALVRVINA